MLSFPSRDAGNKLQRMVLQIRLYGGKLLNDDNSVAAITVRGRTRDGGHVDISSLDGVACLRIVYLAVSDNDCGM